MDVSQLKRFSLFEGVEEEKLKKIAPFTMLVEFPEEKVIIQEGGFANDFYAIDEGSVRVEKDGEKIADLGPGDVFGEAALIEDTQRSASVVANEVVRALKIEHWELARMRKAMPEVVEGLVKKVQSYD